MTKVIVKYNGEWQEGVIIDSFYSAYKFQYLVLVILVDLNIKATFFEEDIYYFRNGKYDVNE